ncbi:ARID DNA-binding domain-containing protein [Tanacetum coccineum]|uniref:ARID DNA-binding domain-containing protein n=1 Tax=Tanacetum coccineum TaxID=301880 RepID=A0ABQ5GZF2_9ASTR
MVNTNTNLEANWPYNHRRFGHNQQWYQSKSWKPPRKMSQQEFFQKQIRREKEERIGRCGRQITRSCKDEAFNSSIRQDKLEKNKCFYCREKGHLIRTCPKKIMDDAESSRKYSIASLEKEKENNIAQPEVTLKYPEFIHFNTDGILKGTDQGSWDDFWYLSKSSDKHLFSNLNMFCNIKEKFLVNNLEDQKKFLFTYGMGEDTKKDEMARYEEDVNPSEVHTFQEFVGFLNLIKNDDVTSAPLASQKGKEKIEHFGIKLEDEENCKEQQTAHHEEDQITCYRCHNFGHYAYQCPSKLKNQGNYKSYKEPSTSKIPVKGKSSKDSSSEDLNIIT